MPIDIKEMTYSFSCGRRITIIQQRSVIKSTYDFCKGEIYVYENQRSKS